MFQVEFNELKGSLETTVEKNPVLSKEQEYVVFNGINTAKNAIFRICLEDEASYAKFLSIVAEHDASNTLHEVFMFGAFEDGKEFDEKTSSSISFLKSIPHLMQTTVISELLQHNISFDIYRSISSEYLKCRTEGPVLRILSADLQYNINRMYLSNVKILLRILSQYKHTVDLTAKDLFSEGAIGLKRAIELFNCELGIKFSTYASQWIKASINRAIADKDSMIRIPVNVREQSKEAEKIKKRLRAELKREPSEEEVIACMRKKPSSLSHIDTSFSYYNISNEDSDSNAANNSSFDENLIDRGIFDECDNSAIRELRDVIKNYIDGIKVPSERYYIQYHFGLNPEMEIKSKEEIISDLKIPPTEYDRIRKKVLANLKRVLGKNRSMIEANSIESGWESRSNLGY